MAASCSLGRSAGVSLLIRRLNPSARVVIPCCTMYKNPYIERHHQGQPRSDFDKQTTGLTGLKVSEHPHRALSVAYGRILRALEKIPETAAYRKYTAEIIKHRMDLVQNVQEPDIRKLEEKIGMGQIEEVIQQAEYELQSVRKIIEYKAWEPLVEQAPVDQWKWPV